MDQMSFAEAEYQNKKRKTRREKFLERVDSLIPWPRLVKKLKRHYHKGPDRSSAVSPGNDAAYSLHAAFLQSQ
jgi:hypothetical protein